VAWYARKAEALSGADRSAIEEEMITKFFDNRDTDVERIIARMLLRKIERTSDQAERAALSDRLIKRYQGDVNSLVLYAVVRAMVFEAEAAEGDAAKLELYSAIINRYRDIDDYSVKKAVDEVIAAKYRLELGLEED
jgi:hypothetical protein